MKKIKIFCIPFAGGSQFSYLGYRKEAISNLELLLLDLPGRGKRLDEKCLTDIHAMTDDVFQNVVANIKEPYAIYGHSMGGLIAFLLTKKIIKKGITPPLKLYLTGRGGPSVIRKDEMKHTLPREAFIQTLKDLGGMDHILADHSLIEFFEPILRADLQAAERYQYTKEKPFDIPITVLIGEDEKITLEEASAWQAETTHPLTLKQLPGNHFFIFQHEKEIMEMIFRELSTQTNAVVG